RRRGDGVVAARGVLASEALRVLDRRAQDALVLVDEVRAIEPGATPRRPGVREETPLGLLVVEGGVRIAREALRRRQTHAEEKPADVDEARVVRRLDFRVPFEERRRD